MSDINWLYVFFVMMRMHNLHNLIWWACCNAAAECGHGGNRIPIYFGVSSSQIGLLKRLNAFNTKDTVAENTIRTVIRDKFVVMIFDNSQVMLQRKFQCESKSSDVSITTSRLILKAIYHHALERITFPDVNVKITYCNQKIPSPHGMPPIDFF